MNEPETSTLFARSEFRRGLIASWHVILRELREMGRQKRTYVLRTACVLVPVLFVTFMVSVGNRQSSIDSMGRELFLVLSWTQLIMICLIAPATTAGWLETERNNRTLEVLFTTPLTSAAIIGGKSLSRLLEVLLMTLSIVPVHVALLLLGGVERAEVMQVLVLTMATGFFAGTFGILCSVVFPRSKRPVTTVLSLLILMWLALPIFLPLIVWRISGIEPWSGSFEIHGATSLLAYPLLWFIEAIHPFQAMFKISIGMAGVGGGGAPWLASWSVTPITLCVLSVLMVVIATWRLRAAALLVPIFSQTAQASRKAAGAAAAGQKRAFWFRIFQESTLAEQNPVAWLVKRQSVPTDWRGVVRKVLISALCIGLICMAIKALVDLRRERFAVELVAEWLFSIGFLIWLSLGLNAATYGARCFVEERSAGTLDILLTTALSGSAIVWGKFWGFFKLYGLFIAVFVPCWIVPYWFTVLRSSYSHIEALALILLPFLVLGLLVSIVVFGMWVSSRASTPTRAVLTTLIGIALLFMAQFMVMGGLVASTPHMRGKEVLITAFFVFFLSTYAIAGFMVRQMIRRLRPADE